LKRAAFVIFLAFAGCEAESAPPPNETMSGPELSHAREPRMEGDPVGPPREILQKTQIVLITESQTSPVATMSVTRPFSSPTNAEPGTASPLNNR